jgi:hypothetical protein
MTRREAMFDSQKNNVERIAAHPERKTFSGSATANRAP